MSLHVRITGNPPLMTQSLSAALQARNATAGTDRAEGADLVVSETESPDVVVVVALRSSAANELAEAHARHPDAHLVWLAGTPDGVEVAGAGAHGCQVVVSQRSDLEDLVRGVRSAGRGEAWTSPDLMAELMDHVRNPALPDRGGLSRREAEVLALLRAGRSTADIAAELYISVHTAKNHIRRILRKLGAHSRLEAVAVAERRHLLDPR